MRMHSILVFLLLMPANVIAAEMRTARLDADAASLGRTAAAASPVVKESYEYYPITGSCETDLRAGMKQNGIRKDDGNTYNALTTWRLRWDYGRTRTLGSCSPADFRVYVDILFRYPDWVDRSKAPGQLVDKWNRYQEHLVLHETGHRNMAIAAAADLMHAVSALPPAGSCEELDNRIANLCRVRLRQLNEHESAYDEVTSHGFGQGAAFP